MRRDSKEIGLSSFPKDDQPPVVIPFFAFRAMVGCELLMIALAWPGSFHLLINRKKGEWLLSCATFLSLPLPFIATLTSWFTAEVGRQPWSVYGALRTADAITPILTGRAVTVLTASSGLAGKARHHPERRRSRSARQSTFHADCKSWTSGKEELVTPLS
jgi:cytochrome bd ubiquinol oxidase subunit I